MIRVLVCGQRDFTDRRLMTNVLRTILRLGPFATVIHGGATGADAMAGAMARVAGCRVRVFPADWRRYGRGAGPIRNGRMLTEGRPDYVLAFYNRGGRRTSRGTNNMVEQARAAGITVWAYEPGRVTVYYGRGPALPGARRSR